MTLVRRLAEKWKLDNPEIVNTGNNTEDQRVCERDARWWLNAIADELAKRTDTQHSARWLRSQAQETSDD